MNLPAGILTNLWKSINKDYRIEWTIGDKKRESSIIHPDQIE